MSHFLISRFFINFCTIKIDLSGNTVWLQGPDFDKLAKIDYFWHFQWTFVRSKCKCSSLRSECWRRLFCDFQTLCVVRQWYIDPKLKPRPKMYVISSSIYGMFHPSSSIFHNGWKSAQKVSWFSVFSYYFWR